MEKLNDDQLRYFSEEFNMLKDAHFQTSQKIITFFQYALLIFSAPLALLTSDKISALLLGIVFILISIIELMVLAYLTSLRAESLLYARQINKIRNVIYSDGLLGNDVEAINNRKILFSQEQKPDYKDTSQFAFIVLVLAFFSAFYFSYGVYKVLPYFFEISVELAKYIAIPCIPIVLILARIIYKTIVLQNENGTNYYRRIIGVDIDGVLNQHERTFVDICNQINNTHLQISDIVTLPVHKSGIISFEQEQQVFKTKEYWDCQKPADNVVENLIYEIKNKYGYRPYIFTWRDWDVSHNLLGKAVSYNIKKETKRWLKDSEIDYCRIRFERGNIDQPISQWSLKHRTRFHFSKKYRIRFFVEDNIDNSVRLSKICEYVFLINHQYNLSGELPYNVIRVNNWDEIFSWIKKLN